MANPEEKQLSKNPKVFMSYCWTTPAHEQFVIDLATRLRSDGVDVILDKWHLKHGDDKNAFMEKMVTDPDVTNVLMVFDKTYAEKADARKGGVGTESQIISQEVYKKVEGQTKFIGLVVEKKSDGEAYVPAYYASRIFIDLSTAERLNDNYEQLLRAIFDKPLHVPPALGKPPAFLEDKSRPVSKSSAKLLTLKNAIMNDKRPLVRGLLREYFDAYLTDLKLFELVPKDKEPLDETVVSALHSMLPLRDELVDAVRSIARFTEDPKLFETLQEFMQKLGALSRYRDSKTDHFSYFVWEAFLYVATVLIQERRFDELEVLLSAGYVDENHTKGIRYFFHTISCLENDRNNRISQGTGRRRFSVMADLAKERATLPDVPFEDLIQTDLLLFMRTALNKDATWYPKLHVFAEYRGAFPLFKAAHTPTGFPILLKLLLMPKTTKKGELHKTFVDAYKEQFQIASDMRNVGEVSDSNLRDL
ncbi:toll/interleukin-1 receptor domain-containing protein [Oscillatoria laete-virens NRMC-F 0139]|nr:toll/interleukin-1 receptor domain-containing protein [Oscillatoria laete-virens]MDL5053319.1 toll/interleukin-1 receptor domain-containing protein [Oscillatoria laete-virens NRMC-F 0139]